MVRIKKMNQSTYASFLRKIKVAGEIVRSRQEEKEGLLDEFDAEGKRFFFGKISEKSLASTVNKANTELIRLDKEIRLAISDARIVSGKVVAFTAAQAPIKYRATLSGIVGVEKKTVRRRAKKRVSRKKPVKKRVVRKKKVRRKPARKKR